MLGMKNSPITLHINSTLDSVWDANNRYLYVLIYLDKMSLDAMYQYQLMQLTRYYCLGG